MLDQYLGVEQRALESGRPNPRFGRARRHPELERLICAAVSNQRFAALLIAEPDQALRQSEFGRRLSPTEYEMVLSITDAADIHEFAGRLHDLVHQRPSGADYLIVHMRHAISRLDQ